MRTIKQSLFCATCAGLLASAPLFFSSTAAFAQTMGEYGAVTAHAAGVGASASTMRPPEVHVNPVSTSGSSKSVEIDGQTREDDSATAAHDKDDDSAKADEWSEVKN